MFRKSNPMNISVCPFKQYCFFAYNLWSLCVVCDDCNTLHRGDCPVHGPLKLLDDSGGQDQASLVHTQLPVPSPLTVKPSAIPGAGLGVFANQFIPKRVRMGPCQVKRPVIQTQDGGGGGV